MVLEIALGIILGGLGLHGILRGWIVFPLVFAIAFAFLFGLSVGMSFIVGRLMNALEIPESRVTVTHPLLEPAFYVIVLGLIPLLIASVVTYAVYMGREDIRAYLRARLSGTPQVELDPWADDDEDDE